MSILIRVAIVLLCPSTPVLAQWSNDPSNPLIVGYGMLSEVSSDGAGGCYISYQQGSNYPRHVAITRLNRFGYQAWGAPKQLHGIYPDQNGPHIVGDGRGGALVAYLDQFDTNTTYTYRVRVQHLDSGGNILWGAAGVRTSLSETNQSDEALVSDGKGGCIVAWFDTLTVLRVNRIDQTGSRSWGDNGIAIDGSDSYAVQMVSDGMEGAILHLIDSHGARFHRIDSAGEDLWPLPLSPELGWGSFSFISDGQGGVYTVGMTELSYNGGDSYYTARTKRIDSVGRTLWDTAGIILGDSIQNTVSNTPSMTLVQLADGSIQYEWYVRVDHDTLNTYTQRLMADGQPTFPRGGIPVSVVSSQIKAGGSWMIPGGGISTIHLWADNRTPGGMYAQMIDTNGHRLWGDSDKAACLISIGGVGMVSDNAGGGIVVGWREYDFTVRAQQINRFGDLGQVISDVNNDGNSLPMDVTLSDCYPNPFNPSTQIRFTLPKAADITLKIFNVLGAQVAALVAGREEPGEHVVIWNASKMPSGVYFYRLSAGDFLQTKKMVLMK